jgi:hypothetical protein
MRFSWKTSHGSRHFGTAFQNGTVIIGASLILCLEEGHVKEAIVESSMCDYFMY